MHHGTIQVSTKAGQGSAFIVSLPIEGSQHAVAQDELTNQEAA
jgi:signal transduction histidine kinase